VDAFGFLYTSPCTSYGRVQYAQQLVSKASLTARRAVAKALAYLAIIAQIADDSLPIIEDAAMRGA
jgi:hypothetical protein